MGSISPSIFPQDLKPMTARELDFSVGSECEHSSDHQLVRKRPALASTLEQPVAKKTAVDLSVEKGEF